MNVTFFIIVFVVNDEMIINEKVKFVFLIVICIE